MGLSFNGLNWLPIIVCVVAGQVFLTVYFTAVFGKPWAAAYGPGKTPKEHTAEVPKYTYAIGAACTFALTLVVALLQGAIGVTSIGDAIKLGAVLSTGLVLASMAPGYAFLRRWSAFWLAAGSQVALTIMVSIILAAWP